MDFVFFLLLSVLLISPCNLFALFCLLSHIYNLKWMLIPTILKLQDYGMESDESRVYNAAHLMVASLAGSLAHVTCKVYFTI